MLTLSKPVETPEPFKTRFSGLGIKAVTYLHQPVFRVEDGRAIKQEIGGKHTKNLFLKDKKDNFFLVTALFDTQIDLKKLRLFLGVANLSFGSADYLLEKLGVTPGSVTPLALVNDQSGVVRGLFDAAIFTDDTWVHCHPLTNDKTTGLSPNDLKRFIEDTGHTPQIVDFTAI